MHLNALAFPVTDLREPSTGYIGPRNAPEVDNLEQHARSVFARPALATNLCF